MSAAKSLFLERMAALARSTQIDAVTDKPLNEQSHNDVARMLRNGLAVVGFAALEDFIKLRSGEVLAQVGGTPVAFSSLPERLRNAVTFEAVSALAYQLSIRQKADRISYIQEHSAKISSTATAGYELTPHAFGYDRANIEADTIKSILKSFLIDDPWGEMTQLAARVGLIALPLEETFRTAALRRHRAAHVAHADIPQADMFQFIKEAFAIALGFDTLITRALAALRKGDAKYLNGTTRLRANSVVIRTVKLDGRVWRERLEGRSRSVRSSADLSALIAGARERSVAAKNLLVHFRDSGHVSSWECY